LKLRDRALQVAPSLEAYIPVIFVTIAKKADAAIEAMKQGAYDYLFKPLDPHRLRRVVGGV
jgi:DNA-binding NtrC family response regulator